MTLREFKEVFVSKPSSYNIKLLCDDVIKTVVITYCALSDFYEDDVFDDLNVYRFIISDRDFQVYIYVMEVDEVWENYKKK